MQQSLHQGWEGAIAGNGGELAMRALRPWGVNEIFTLSGGHIFPILDACHSSGIRIVDTRHEQTAAFAAEAMAKLERRPGVAVLTAGPGVTNGISAITTAHFNGSPLVVLGGRAPENKWGSGSLQELDHLPIVDSVTKYAVTAFSVADGARLVAQAAVSAATPHRGPVFVDLPIETAFGLGSSEDPYLGYPDLVPAETGRFGIVKGEDPDTDRLDRAVTLLSQSERPALVAGGDVWLSGAEEDLVNLVETVNAPVFMNGQGRGCVPADHPLAFCRVRGALKEADVVAVIGTPLDFRLSFGKFGEAAVIHIVDSADRISQKASPEVTVAGDIGKSLRYIAERAAHSGDRRARSGWIEPLRARENAEKGAQGPVSSTIHPVQVYREAARRLDRDAVVIGDGGDFVSFAGKLVESYQPGCWLDPGPYGCLGTGIGYAVAARLARPDRQVVAFIGDGAFGFTGMDVDTLVRHRLDAVLIIGNNGMWGLEKHPMRALYGYDVAADLQPGCRYDNVVKALGGAGETVEDPEDLGPALDRALSAGAPYLLNVLLDPEAVYPRSSSLL